MLALLEAGLQTPYDLMTKAGLSPGATLPALGRLEKSRLVRRGLRGGRGRVDYAVTAAGKRALQAVLPTLLSDESAGAEADAVLRTAMLGLLHGLKTGTVAKFLRKAATAKATAASRRKSEADRLDFKPRGADHYKWMKAIQSSARLEADARTFRAVARAISRR